MLLFQYQSKSSVREMMSYSQAGKHAEEVFKSVKTIVAFAGEEKEIHRLATKLIHTYVNVLGVLSRPSLILRGDKLHFV